MKAPNEKSIVLLSRLAASIALVSLGVVLLFAVLQVSGSIGYFDSYAYGSEWLNYSTGGSVQIDDLPLYGWAESDSESGYIVIRASRSVLLPTYLVVGIILLLAGLRLFPKNVA